MKVVVDEFPQTPRDCLFSKENKLDMRYYDDTVYVCTLRPYVEGKPECLCKGIKNCDRLISYMEVSMFK